MSFDLADAICRPSAARNTTHKGTAKIPGEHFSAYVQRKHDDVRCFAAQIPMVVYSTTLPGGHRCCREVTAAAERSPPPGATYAAYAAAGARGDKGKGVIGAGRAAAVAAPSYEHQREHSDAAASDPLPSLCSDRSDESDNNDFAPTPTDGDDVTSEHNSLDGLLEGMLDNLDSIEASARSVLDLLHKSPDLDVDELENLMKPLFEEEGGCDTSTDSQHLRSNDHHYHGSQPTATAPLQSSLEPSPAQIYQLDHTTTTTTAATAAAAASQTEQEHNQAQLNWFWQQFSHVRQSLEFIASLTHIIPETEQWLSSYTPQLREIALGVEKNFADLTPLHQHELQQFIATKNIPAAVAAPIAILYEQGVQDQQQQQQLLTPEQLADADLDRHAASVSNRLDAGLAQDQHRRDEEEKNKRAADLKREDFRAKIHAAAAAAGVVGSTSLSRRR